MPRSASERSSALGTEQLRRWVDDGRAVRELAATQGYTLIHASESDHQWALRHTVVDR